MTSNVQSSAPAPEHVTSMVASASPSAGSISSGMAAKLAGVQVRAGSGDVIGPVLSIAEAPSTKRATGSAPTTGAVSGAVGHVSVGTSA